MPYTYTRNPKASTPVTSDLGGGNTITLQPGQPQTFQTACEMVEFLNGLPADTNYSADNPRVGEDLRREAEAEGCLGDGDNAPANPQPSQPATPPAENPPPPADGDDANRQAAPTPPVSGTVTTPPPTEDPPPEPQPGQPSRTHGGERSQTPAEENDPVGLFSGQFMLTEQDLSVATPLLPLKFVRYHRSGPHHLGPLGWNWDHNHNIYLRELANGSVARWTGRLTEDLFAPEGGKFAPPRGAFEMMERLPGPATAYRITSTGGMTATFEQPPGWTDAERIPLARVEDRHGSTLLYTYNGDNRLARVSDEDGRSFLFFYGDCGLLERLEDHHGRVVDYAHAPDVEHLVEVTLPATPDQPDGVKRCYSYGDYGSHPWLYHSIVSTVDHEGRTVVQNWYGQDPAATDFARVTEQLAGDYLWQYRYTVLQIVPPDAAFIDLPAMRTEVLDPEFGLTTHTFNYRGDTLDHRRRLVKDGSFRVIVHAHDYDAEGNLTRTLYPDGREDLFTYDAGNADPRARSRLLRHEVTARAGFPSPSRIVWRGTYDPLFQLLVSETDETGAVTSYRYDFDDPGNPAPSGRLEEIRHPDATLPDGTVRSATTMVESNARGQVTAVVSPGSIRTEVQHHAGGALKGFPQTRRVVGGGIDLTWQLDYDGLGRLAHVTAPDGGARAYEYDDLDRLLEASAPEVASARATTRAHYDGHGMVIAVERPLGAFSEPGFAEAAIVDRFERDVRGGMIRATYAANCALPATTDLVRDHRGRIVAATDPAGTEVTFYHDERGLLLRRAVSGGDDETPLTVERRVYDRAGRIDREIEAPAENRLTLYAYDAFGRPSEVTMPNGSVRRLTFGEMDRLEVEEVEGDDGAGGVRLLSRRRFERDERGRVIRLVESVFTDNPAAASDRISTFYHDEDSRVARMVDHRGGDTFYAHDGLGRLTRVSRPSGDETVYEYDDVAPLRRRRRRFDEGGAISERVFTTQLDARGRVLSETDDNGIQRQVVWDDRNLPVREIEPGGVVREREHGPLGEMLAASVTSGAQTWQSRWTYNARREVTAFEDPQGARTTFTYDALARPQSVTYPGGAQRQLAYTGSGDLAEELLPSGIRLQRSYDAAGRMTGMSAVGAPLDAHAFAYDGLDRLVRAQAGGLAVERRYDSLGRLIEESGAGVVLSLTHDDATGAVVRRWPDGRRERVTSDADGRPDAVQRVAAGALGAGPADLATFSSRDRQLLNASYLGLLNQELAYDRSDRPVRQQFSAAGGPIEGQECSHDSRHRRRVERRLGPAGDSRHFDYDRRDRLERWQEGFASPAPGDLEKQAGQDAHNAAVAAAAAGASSSASYVYSDADERLSRTASPGPVTNYAYDADHALAAVDGNPVIHDADRVRSAEPGRSYVSDALGRIVRVEDAGGQLLAEWRYDALGRVASLAENGASPVSFHRFGNEVWLEIQAGADLRQHTASPFGRGSLAIHQTGESLLCLRDLRGSLASLCDQSGALVERFAYAPFGRPAIFAPDGTPRAASAFGIRPLFGGALWLESAGLYLAGQRLIHPEQGIFLSPDPHGYAAGPNLYVYAHHDPVNLVDPDGAFPFLAILAVVAIGAAIGGGASAVRQGIQIAEGSRDEFSWGEVATGAGFGAVAAPLLVFAPELAIPLAGIGVASGVSEISQGNYATGAFDIATSLLPFGFKGPRNASFGRGSVFAPRRGLGPSATRAERAARFSELDANLRLFGRNLYNRRFYRGTTYYEAEAAAGENALDLGTVLGRQHEAEAPPRLGPGLYFTEELNPPSQGTAPYWADVHGGSGRGGGPAVLEAEIPRWRWWLMRRRPGAVEGVEQPDFPVLPSTRETFVPEALAPDFNNQANWRNLPWDFPEPLQIPPRPGLSTAWPLVFTPTYRPPDDASAEEDTSSNGGQTQGK